MEPKASMTAFSVIVLVAVSLLSLQGNTKSAEAIAAGLAGFGLALNLSYIVRSRQRRCLILEPRRSLDRIVLAQCLAILFIGVGIAELSTGASLRPLASDSDAVRAILIAVSLGIATIYASSLVDWYWVLPKVSGIVAQPPCTTLVAKSYAGVTKIWFFHRAVATATITALIAGTPAYIAGTIDAGAPGRAALTILGAAAAIGFNAATAGTVWAFGQFLNPTFEVGSYMRRRKNVDDVHPQDAYLVDVSVQGLKVKLEGDVDGEFVNDGDLIPYHEAVSATKSSRTDPLCPSLHECRAVNWYCLRNVNANTSFDLSRRCPADLPAEAREVDRPAE